MAAVNRRRKDEARMSPADHRGNRSKGVKVSQATDPEWASGLKRLYDRVVEEPLPDAFRDLLSRLDDSEHK